MTTNLENITLHNGDCLEVMPTLLEESVELVVTSPPYDNLRNYGGVEWNFEIFRSVADNLYRIVKQGGVVVWVVGDATIKGSETGTAFRQALYFKEIGFNIHDTMIWEKTGMLPTQDRYYNIFEYMFVFSKGKPKAMNFIEDKPNTAGGRVQKRDACINKGTHKEGDGTFIRKEVGRRTNVWRIPIGKNKDTNGHPAPFPLQLAQDHIITWSNDGDIVLDPFMGSGTTIIACQNTNRKGIGIELMEEYYNIAVKRVQEALSKPKTLFNGF